MNNTIYTPFSTAACDVFSMLLNLEADAGTPISEQTNRNYKDTVNIMIGITGDLSGEVYYCIPKRTTLEMVKLMCGMEFEEVDEMVTSAMGEVANIISGNALTGLSEQNISCDLTPPKILYGESLPVSGTDNQLLSTMVKSDIGNVEVNIILEHNA